MSLRNDPLLFPLFKVPPDDDDPALPPLPPPPAVGVDAFTVAGGAIAGDDNEREVDEAGL